MNLRSDVASLFTRREANLAGLTDRRLQWGIESGRYIRLEHGVYFKANRPPTVFERNLAHAMKNGKPVTGELAAALHKFDGHKLRPRLATIDMAMAELSVS